MIKTIMQLIYLILLLSLCSGCASVSNFLGRTERVGNLCDDFENPKWKYNHQKHRSSNGFWRGSAGEKGSDISDRGDPAILERVTPPEDGKSGSTGALKIGTNIPDDDNNPKQEDLRTLYFEEKLKRKLTRADQPVFIMRVWLPPFDKWGEYYSFGFRLEAQSSNTSDSYYPSIWLKYNNRDGPHFFFRIFYLDGSKMRYHEEYGRPIKQSGWWTLAIAFDEKGTCYYYARPGVDALTEESKIFDDTQFMAKYGIRALLMDRVNAGLFSLGYPEEGNITPRFVIDDYEVRVVK
jgi:hypothetical protein